MVIACYSFLLCILSFSLSFIPAQPVQAIRHLHSVLTTRMIARCLLLHMFSRPSGEEGKRVGEHCAVFRTGRGRGGRLAKPACSMPSHTRGPRSPSTCPSAAPVASPFTMPGPLLRSQSMAVCWINRACSDVSDTGDDGAGGSGRRGNRAKAQRVAWERGAEASGRAQGWKGMRQRGASGSNECHHTVIP